MVKTPRIESKYNFMTLGAGVRWDMSETAYTDLAVTLGMAGGDNIFVDEVTNGGGFDKNMSFNLEGRMFWEFTDNATLVPYIGYSAADFSPRGHPGDERRQVQRFHGRRQPQFRREHEQHARVRDRDVEFYN